MNINSLFNEALLAQAAYATGLTKGMSYNELVNRLKSAPNAGISQAQAEYFASKYKVVEQYSNEDTGFSATLFQEIETGEYHLTSRGSSPKNPLDPDWNNANLDNLLYGMSVNQVTDYLNFYLRLTHASTVAQFAFEPEVIAIGSPPPSQPYIIVEQLEFLTKYLVFNEIGRASGLNAIAENQQLNLTGHSLGGHLASAFTLLFPSIVSGTTTFNSAGFIGPRFDDFATVMAAGINANGVINLEPDLISNASTPVDNIRAPTDPVSVLLNTSHLGGGLINVFIEAGDDSHGIDKLVDSLAVINLLNILDSNMTLAQANQLLPMASNDEYTELEGTMHHLAELFGQDNIAMTDSDHDKIYTVIKKITDSLDGKTYSISAVSGTIASQALSGDKAALYALINLQPFVVRGTLQGTTDALYQNHSDNGALDIENFSEQYLADRANMLQWLIKYNEEDIDYQKILSVGELKTFTELSSHINYTLKEDQEIGVLQLAEPSIQSPIPPINATGNSLDNSIFGNRLNNVLLGEGGEDELHGLLGNDILYGGSDKDYLFGKCFHGAVGHVDVLTEFCQHQQLKKRVTVSICQRLLA